MKSQSYKTILNPHRWPFKLIGINKQGPIKFGSPQWAVAVGRFLLIAYGLNKQWQ
jgi:hypothetical protein